MVKFTEDMKNSVETVIKSFTLDFRTTSDIKEKIPSDYDNLEKQIKELEKQLEDKENNEQLAEFKKLLNKKESLPGKYDTLSNTLSSIEKLMEICENILKTKINNEIDSDLQKSILSDTGDVQTFYKNTQKEYIDNLIKLNNNINFLLDRKEYNDKDCGNETKCTKVIDNIITDLNDIDKIITNAGDKIKNSEQENIQSELKKLNEKLTTTHSGGNPIRPKKRTWRHNNDIIFF